MKDGLAYEVPISKEGRDEEWQVREVQRLEGVRLGFEVLAWAVGDREGATYFDVSVIFPVRTAKLTHCSGMLGIWLCFLPCTSWLR
jgi:hypothetical protein